VIVESQDSLVYGESGSQEFLDLLQYCGMAEFSGILGIFVTLLASRGSLSKCGESGIKCIW